MTNIFLFFEIYNVNYRCKLSFHYQIIKICFENINAFFDQLRAMLLKTAVIRESVDQMELVTVTAGFTWKIAQVSLRNCILYLKLF